MRWSVLLNLIILLILSPFGAQSARADDDEIVLIGVDNYGSSAGYAPETAKLFPDGRARNKRIKWVHFQTEPEIQDTYKPSFAATKHWYGDRLHRFDLSKPGEKERMLQTAIDYGAYFAFGGMETGAKNADPINDALYRAGLTGGVYLGNDPESSDIRRRKSLMQAEMGDDLRIPTLFSGDKGEILHFAAGLDENGIVLKPDASSSSQFTRFIFDTNPHVVREQMRRIPAIDGAHLRGFRMLGEIRIQKAQDEVERYLEDVRELKDQYGNPLTRVIGQPFLPYTEYVANTIVRDGRVVLVAVWKYIKITLPGGILSYFIDVPIGLDTPIAEELRRVMPMVHARLKHRNGPGHSELFRTPLRRDGRGNWYFGEMGARVGGTGFPMIDKEVWGTSHLHLNILRVLDPDRYEAEVATFPRRKLKEAAIVSLSSYARGQFRRGTEEFLGRLGNVFWPASYYEIHDHDPVEPTKDLTSIAGSVVVTGTAQEVISSVGKLVRGAARGEMFDYEENSGSLWNRCAFRVGHESHRRNFESRLSEVNLN